MRIVAHSKAFFRHLFLCRSTPPFGLERIDLSLPEFGLGGAD
jgi:hypothetical protein